MSLHAFSRLLALCMSHRVHFALVLEKLFIILVHIVFIPVKMCRDLALHGPRMHTLPMRTPSLYKRE